MADAARNEIIAYSREKLGFIPWFDPAWKPGQNPSPPQTLFQKQCCPVKIRSMLVTV